MRVCAGLWSLITPRWILISVWWDTKHQSQSTNALATNHFNEYILFWPLSELFFVFHITFPLPHYSLSVLALFCIHTLPFNSLSHPVMLLFFPSTCLSFSLTHLSFGFFPFVSSLFNIFPPLSLPCSSPLPPTSLCITSTVKTTQHASKMELVCLYSERSQVQSVNWKYQNKSRQLKMSSNSPGSISTTLPMPITSETAGNYTCTLQLKNGQIVWATQAVRLPYEGEKDAITKTGLFSDFLY